jgi:hypothetical protein
VGKERIEFVDSISASATIRLSLTTAPVGVLLSGTSVPPPPLRRVVVNTLLSDGSLIPAAAYDNREITIRVQVDATTPAQAATFVQMLNRELDRQTNILRWQPEPDLPPVYFRTFRSPDYAQEVDHGINLFDFTIVLQAEPFAYGPQEFSPSTVTINNDPAAGSNGKFFEITGVKGDVETPMQFVLGGGIAYHQSVFGMRRKGTPSGAPLFLQCEAMTQGTDTSTQANNTAYSGSGNNYCSTTFGTNNSLTTTRLSTSAFPSAANTNVRGVYRVFVRVNASANGSTFQLRMIHGLRGVSQDSNSFTINDTSRPMMIDMGLIQLPEGFDPVNNGPSGAALSVAGVAISFGASRLGGTASLFTDYMMFVPADDRFCLVDWGQAIPTSYVLDGYSRSIYGINGSGQVVDIGVAKFTGDIPYVTPGQTNRFVYINDVSPFPIVPDLASGTCTMDWSYWPRYLYVRPLTT